MALNLLLMLLKRLMIYLLQMLACCLCSCCWSLAFAVEKFSEILAATDDATDTVNDVSRGFCSCWSVAFGVGKFLSAKEDAVVDDGSSFMGIPKTFF